MSDEKGGESMRHMPRSFGERGQPTQVDQFESNLRYNAVKADLYADECAFTNMLNGNPNNSLAD